MSSPHPLARAPRQLVIALTAVALALASAGAATAKGPATPAERAQAALDHWLADKDLARAKVGASVVCLDDGSTWAAHDADALMVPASGAKLLTTAAVLDLLPLDTRFPTRLRAAVGAAGVVSGDLVLEGGGDPQLMPEDLQRLADLAIAAGLARVDGDLVVDASRFAPPILPPAYDTKRTDASYRASVSAAEVNYGAVLVTVRAGKAAGDPLRVTVSPASAGVLLDNTGVTVASKGAPLEVTATDRSDGRTNVAVRGSLKVGDKGFAGRFRVADPGLLAGYLLEGILVKKGVRVKGGVRVREVPADGEPAPVVAAIESKPLAELLRAMNTWSNNAMAETFFKHLGGAGAAPRTWEAAKLAVGEALVARGVAAGSFEIVNGSGLYEATRVSARAMSTLLASFGGDDPRSLAFRDSLAVAGEPGTLHYRLKRADTRGKVRAKTGTLDEVHSISGYVTAKSGCHLAFALFVNDGEPKRSSALRGALDKLILELVRL